jgi:hypothetical protein
VSARTSQDSTRKPISVVWAVVHPPDWDPPRIRTLWTSRELAEAEAAAVNADQGRTREHNMCYVEEWTLDVPDLRTTDFA